jgi:hypothetical protein
MIEPIEVIATRSFMHPLHPNGQFLRGRPYQVDLDDAVVRGLIAAGYFKVVCHGITEEPDNVVDLAGVDEFPGSGVGTRRTRPKKKKTGEPEGQEVGDGQGPDRPDPQGPDGPRLRDSTGSQDD